VIINTHPELNKHARAKIKQSKKTITKENTAIPLKYVT